MIARADSAGWRYPDVVRIRLPGMGESRELFTVYDVRMVGFRHVFCASFAEFPDRVVLAFVRSEYLVPVPGDSAARAPELPLVALWKHPPIPFGLPVHFRIGEVDQVFLPSTIVIHRHSAESGALLIVNDPDGIRRIRFDGHGVWLAGGAGLGAMRFVGYEETGAIIEVLLPMMAATLDR